MSGNEMDLIGAINAVAIVILVLVTICYAYSTHKLVKIEEEREKGKQRKYLNTLLAEFRVNKGLLEDLKTELENRSLSREVVFLGFKDDGWNIFRNSGGFQYIEEPLYYKIEKYYVSQYKIQKEQEIRLDLYYRALMSEEFLDRFYDSLIKKILVIEKENDTLQSEVKRILDETV